MAQASRTRNYLAGLSSGYVVTFATIFVGLWLTPFTLRYLSREEFAVFTLASDVLMWLGLLDIGISAVLNVKAAQISGRPDQEQLNRLSSTTFFAQCGIALAFLAFGAAVTLIFPAFFALEAKLQHDAMQVMALLVLGSALSIGTQTFSALLIAHQQIHVDNFIRLLLLALRVLITVVLLIAGVGLISLAVANLVATLVTALLSVYRVRRYLPGLTIARRYFSWDILKETGGLGIWFSLGGISAILIANLDKIVTAKVVSVEMVTTLALTGRVYALAWTLIQQVTNSARPALAQIIGQGKMEHALRKYHQLMALSTGLALLAAAVLWAGNAMFVPWWVGQNNYGGQWLDLFLAINLVVHSWVLPNRAILVAGMAYVPQNAVSRFVEGLLNLALSIGFGYLWGVHGIILATAVAGLLTSCWYFPLLTARYFKVDYLRLLLADIPRLAIFAAMIFPLAYVGKVVAGGMHGVPGIVVASGSCGVVGLILFWLVVLDVELKQGITGRFVRSAR